MKPNSQILLFFLILFMLGTASFQWGFTTQVGQGFVYLPVVQKCK